MKITRESDYALRIMRCLAAKDGVTDAKTVAGETGVPLRFTVKILSKLVTGGLVKSRKGAAGGYELGKQPTDITMRDIIEQIEGPLVISRCLSDGFCCDREPCGGACSCYYNQVFDEINAMITEKLSGITLDDVIRGKKLVM